MNGTDTYWRAAILSRFAGREKLSKEELYDSYFRQEGLPKEAVLECLGLIDEEYEFLAGFLRPEDKLKKLFEPVATKNPWRWLVYQVREGDSETELGYQLGKRTRQHGTFDARKDIETVGDFIRAWCGQKPHQE